MIESLRDEAHIWFVIPESVRDTATIECCKSIMSPEELAQYQRFHFPRDSHLYLVSHALARVVLSKYAEIDPVDWRFSRNQHGRPEVVNSGNIPPLRFNLTHTPGLAACIVNLSHACGIDAEKLVQRHNPLGVAKKMFSEAEFNWLQQLNGPEKLERFFEGWTLREAYVKALGIGISFPTWKLDFTVHKGKSVEVSFRPDIEDQQKNWQFQLFKPTKEHIAAIAVRRDSAIEKKIVARFIELQEEEIKQLGKQPSPERSA